MLALRMFPRRRVRCRLLELRSPRPMEQGPLMTPGADGTGVPSAPGATSPPDKGEVAAHTQAENHKYVMHFPAHEPRTGDPHYAAFNAYHRRFGPTARCYVGTHIGDSECSTGPLELHHAHVEFSLQNGIDLDALREDFPGLASNATQDEIDNWVESDANFMWLCAFHHRGHGGAHTAAYADWVAQLYVKGLIS